MINLAKLPLSGRKACLRRKYCFASCIALDTGWSASLTGEREVVRGKSWAVPGGVWDSFTFFCHSCGVEIRALRAKIIRVLRTKISFLNLTRHVKATDTAFLHVD